MSHTIEFANFTLKFGEKNLVDFLAEIVLPAFFDSTPTINQRYASTIMIQNVSVVQLQRAGEVVHAITGRFIRSAPMRRRQYLDENNILRKDPKELYTAPSGVFTLTLEDHILIYTRETEGAPGLEAFSNFILKNLKIKYNAFIRGIYLDREQEFLDGTRHAKSTLTALAIEFPKPELNLIPLSNPETLQEFIDKFSKLRRAEAKITDTNHTIDDDAFFDEMRKRKQRANSQRTTYVHANPTEGLDKSSIADEMSGAHSGNAVVSLQGLDAEGRKLEGDNKDFKVKTQVESIGQTIPETASISYSAYLSMLDSGSLIVSQTPASQLKRARDIIEREIRSYDNRGK